MNLTTLSDNPERTLFIFGNSGHAKMVGEIATLQGYTVFFITLELKDDSNEILEDDFFKSIQNTHSPVDVFLGIGKIEHRAALHKKLLEISKCNFPNIIHPTAWIAPSAKIGHGNYIGAFTVINTSAEVGDFTIINTRAIVEHNCIISEFCNLSPGAVLAGNVLIDEQSFLGLNCSVIESIRVSKNTIVGAGAVVTKEHPPYSKLIGVPARDFSNPVKNSI